MQKYNIAGLTIEIVHNKSLALDRFKPFLYLGGDTPDIIVKIYSCKHIQIPKGKMILDEKIKWIRNLSGNSSISVYICGKEPDDIAYLMNANNKWDEASIIYQEVGFNAEYAATGPLSEILFRNRILFKEGLVIHASAIEWEGRGILFSAPSETGKTTQARLWCNEMGASLISDDRPAVKIIEDKVYVYGTPWSGALSECNNNFAQLTAVIILEQAIQNSIYKLSAEESILKLMPRCFLPYHDGQLMNIAVSNLENLLKHTPVYLLKCRPDTESVKLAYKTIWRDVK